MTEQLEYVGDTKFSPCDIKAKVNLEGWLHRAREEFAMKGQAIAVLNMSDEQLEQYARSLADTDEKQAHAIIDLAEWFGAWKSMLEDGAGMADAAALRMVVIAERLAGREHMEETYRQN